MRYTTLRAVLGILGGIAFQRRREPIHSQRIVLENDLALSRPTQNERQRSQH
jgi:hypothetical protein